MARLSGECRFPVASYQEPLEGQPPLPSESHVRTAAPPPVFVIVNTLVDFDVVVIV